MEILGGVLAVTNATIQTASSLWSLCDAWREAPAELHRLLEDLRRAQQFFHETQNGIENSYSSSRGYMYDFPGALDQLLDEGSSVIGQIGHLVDRLRSGDGDGELKPEELGKRRKAIWIRQTVKMARLRKKLKHVIVSMCRLLVAQNMSASADIRASIEQSKAEIMSQFNQRLESTEVAISDLGEAIHTSQTTSLTYINRRLETMQASMISAVRDPIREELALLRLELAQGRRQPQLDEVPYHKSMETWGSFERRSIPSVMRVGSPCNIDCRCRCHSGRSYSRWSTASLSSILGAMTVTHAGIPSQVCTDKRCRSSRGRRPASQELGLVYYFPDWLVRAAISVFYSSNLNGSPEMVIRVFHRLSSGRVSDAHNIFGYIDRDDVEGVKRLLQERRGSVYDVRYARNVSPLFAAAERQKIDMVKVLLQAGADPYQETTDGRSSILCAFQYFLSGSPGAAELVQLLPVFSGLELSPLHMAIIGVLHIDISDALRRDEYLSDLNRMDLDRYSPLHLAAIRGDASSVKVLLDAGAEVDACGASGKTPLSDACAWGHYEVARLLLDAGAAVNMQDSFGLGALARAAGYKGTERRLLSLLVERGADVNLRARDFSAPVAHAVAYGCLDAAEFLIGCGADMENRDAMGDTAIVEGLMSGDHEVVRLLLRSGCDVRSVNYDGIGLLHHLAAEGDVEMMRIFSERGMKGLRRYGGKGKSPQELFEDRSVTPELRKGWEALLESVEYEVEDDEDEYDEFVDAMEKIEA